MCHTAYPGDRLRLWAFQFHECRWPWWMRWKYAVGIGLSDIATDEVSNTNIVYFGG